MIRSKRASFALLCGAATAALTAGPFTSPAKAIFRFDVRAVGVTGAGNVLVNDKSVFVGAGGTVTFELWGLIETPYRTGEPEDGNPNNEANKVAIGSFLTTGTSVHGNLSATVVPAMQNLGYSSGTIQDLDADGDLDVGSNNTTTSNMYWAVRSTDIVNGMPGQAGLLGTMTLTITSADPTDTTNTLVNFRRKGGAPNSAGSWNENGNTVLSDATNMLTGAPVSITAFFDPEPASTGLLTIVGLTSLARRKSRR